MLRFTIEGVGYDCPDSWTEITIAKMERVAEVVEELPEKVTDYYRSLISEEPVTVSEDVLSPVRLAVLGIICDMSDEIAACVPTKCLAEISQNLLDPIIVSVLVSPIYEPMDINEFEYRGEKFTLPASGTDVMGQAMPLSGIQTKEMCEASDVSMDANFKLASLVVAILCRPEGEEYDEEKVKIRNKIFRELPVYIFLEVFNKVNRAHSYLMGEYPLCYGMNEAGAQIKGKGKKTSWSDRMLFVADDKPSELPLVEKMRFYDFMRLLNGKIKRQRDQWQMK